MVRCLDIGICGGGRFFAREFVTNVRHIAGPLELERTITDPEWPRSALREFE